MGVISTDEIQKFYNTKNRSSDLSAKLKTSMMGGYDKKSVEEFVDGLYHEYNRLRSQLDDEIRILTSEKVQIKQEAKMYKDQVNNSDGDVKKISEQFTTKMAEKDKRIQVLEEQIEDMERHVIEQERIIKNMNSDDNSLIDSLKNEFKGMQKNLENQLKDKESELSQCYDRIDHLEDRVVMAEDKNKQMYDEMSETINIHQQKCESLSELLDRKDLEIENLKEKQRLQVEDLNEQIGGLRGENQDQAREMDALRVLHEKQVSDLREDYERQMGSLRVDHEKKLSDLRDEGDAMTHKLRSEKEFMISRLQDEQQAEITKIQEEKDFIIDGLKRKVEDNERAINEANDALSQKDVEIKQLTDIAAGKMEDKLAVEILLRKMDREISNIKKS